MAVKKAAHVSDARAKEIIDRAAAQGRDLRQDEKAKLNGPPILLAHSFDDADVDPTGWWMSEKLDGVRAYWNGHDFVSRQGNVFIAPSWFKKGLPSHPLDGELWMGRQQFQSTVSAIRHQEMWHKLKYLVFDFPHETAVPFEFRMNAMRCFIESTSSEIVKLVEQTPCKGMAHLKRELAELVALGAEGLMIRKPGSLYEAKRSHTILKVKPWQDAEAAVIGHEPGKGRNKGRLGALVVRMPNGNTFNIGTGFSDAQREKPPHIGATVSYRFTELTRDGLPKCGSFIAVRDYE